MLDSLLRSRSRWVECCLPPVGCTAQVPCCCLHSHASPARNTHSAQHTGQVRNGDPTWVYLKWSNAERAAPVPPRAAASNDLFSGRNEKHTRTWGCSSFVLSSIPQSTPRPVTRATSTGAGSSSQVYCHKLPVLTRATVVRRVRWLGWVMLRGCSTGDNAGKHIGQSTVRLSATNGHACCQCCCLAALSVLGSCIRLQARPPLLLLLPPLLPLPPALLPQ